MKKIQQNLKAQLDTQWPRSVTGFTLGEIIIVVTIIGVLSFFALPNFTIALEKSRAAEGQHLLHVLFSAQKRHEVEKGSYSSAINQLDVQIPPPTNFESPVALDGSSQGVLAQVARSDTTYTYTLRIDTGGDVTCSGSICGRLGFEPAILTEGGGGGEEGGGEGGGGGGEGGGEGGGGEGGGGGGGGAL